MFRVAGSISVLLIGATPEAGGAFEDNPSAPTVEYVRKILDSDVDEVWRLKYKLLELGPKAFPVYEKLLADPKTNSGQVSRIFSVLREVPGDRSSFLETAIKNLTNPSFSVRYSAIRLVGAIGSERDTAPLVASLYDKEIGIISAAAEALAEIGGRRELVAFDVWLRAAKARGIGKPLIDMLRKHRDALEFRLKLEEKNKALEEEGKTSPKSPPSHARDDSTPAPTVEYVRKILDSDAETQWRLKYRLLELGTKAFPSYEKLLADPKTSTNQVARIFSVLREVPGDRSRFVETAVKSLTSPAPYLRDSAVRLLGAIGSRRDTAPIVASLYDNEIVVISAAAETLVELGGQRELVAFDVWLRAAKARGIGKPLIDMLRKHRDALEFRLKLEEKNKALEEEGKAAPKPRPAP